MALEDKPHELPQSRKYELAALCAEIAEIEQKLNDCKNRGEQLRLNRLRSQKAVEVMSHITDFISKYTGLYDFLVEYLLTALDKGDTVALGMKTFTDQRQHSMIEILKVALCKEALDDNNFRKERSGDTRSEVSEMMAEEGINASPSTVNAYWKKMRPVIQRYKSWGFSNAVLDQDGIWRLSEPPTDKQIEAFLKQLKENQKFRRFAEGEKIVLKLLN